MPPHIAQWLRPALRPVGALLAALSLVSTTLLVTPTSAQAAERASTGFTRSFTAAGQTSTYSVYADGLDWSRPVGVSFYFDGDGQYWAKRPGASLVQRMARHAAERNMVLVVPLAPDRVGTPTWWENRDGNGDWFRTLAAHLVQRHGLDTRNVWLAGYSGGAQFITGEVLADRQNWIRGGGAVVIGGGGSRGMQTTPSAEVRSVPIRWVTGSEDVAGATQPPSWSALADAKRGRDVYVRHGFTRTSLHVPAGVDHHGYDHAALLADTLRMHYSGIPSAPTSSGPFRDVADSHPFAAEIAWMHARGISTGWLQQDGTRLYRPGSAIARDQMAAFLYRMAGSPAFSPPRVSPFTDVPTNHVFYKEISWLHARGISTGWAAADGTRTYKPGQAVARDQMAAFLHRLAGRPGHTAPAASPFRDVSPAQGFYREMAWLHATGISTGWDDGTFRPGASVSRDVMAAFLHRFAGLR